MLLLIGIGYLWNHIFLEQQNLICIILFSYMFCVFFWCRLEPAILLMHHSIRSHPTITSTLLDFLCRVTTFFFDPSPPPPTHNCMTEVVTCFWHKTIFSRHMCDHGQSVVDWNPCTFCLWNIFPWVKQTNTIRDISVYGKIPKWILLVIVCFLNIIFQNEIDVANLCRSRNLKCSCANVFQRCCYFYCFKIIPNYSTLPDVQARQGVIKAFRHILSKKVVM